MTPVFTNIFSYYCLTVILVRYISLKMTKAQNLCLLLRNSSALGYTPTLRADESIIYLQTRKNGRGYGKISKTNKCDWWIIGAKDSTTKCGTMHLLSNLALESMSAMALSFWEMCRISEFRDLMYAIHLSIARSDIAHPETIPRIGRQAVSIIMAVPIM